MAPDDPRRLKPGQSVLVSIAPAPPNEPDADPAEHDPALPRHFEGETDQATTDRRAYTFRKSFDFGLLRETPPGSLYFEAWCEPDEHGRGLWHTLNDFDPFSASMSEISVAMAKQLIGKGDLYGPVEDDEYMRQAKANMARYA
jgi:hypothetical protein